MDIDQQDKRGSTPLHWACYSSCEVALSYLLAWRPNLNLQDNDGYTPLHLAVKSVDSVESTRPVRFLLIRGANTQIRDNEGRTPGNLVTEDEVQTEHLNRELKRMLVSAHILHNRSQISCFHSNFVCFFQGNPGFFECLMPSYTSRHAERTPTTLIIYLILSLSCYVIEAVFVFDCK